MKLLFVYLIISLVLPATFRDCVAMAHGASESKEVKLSCHGEAAETSESSSEKTDCPSCDYGLCFSLFFASPNENRLHSVAEKDGSEFTPVLENVISESVPGPLSKPNYPVHHPDIYLSHSDYRALLSVFIC